MQNNDLDLDHLQEQRKFIYRLQRQAAAEKIPVIGKNTGYLLGCIVKIINPGNILEIGCGNGFSSYFILQNMTDRSQYTGIDMNRQRLREARDLINQFYPEKISSFICGNALKIIPGLSGWFDMIFIDAAKFEYPLYLEAVKGKIKKGSIIIADDIFCHKNIFSGNPPKHFSNSVEGLRKYLRCTGPGTGFETNILDIDDGLAISVFRGTSS